MDQDISTQDLRITDKINPMQAQAPASTKELPQEDGTIKKEIRCNCNDEFKTEPCPIHFGYKDKYDKKSVIVTDANLVREEIRQWVGYTYICPKCGEAAILDVMKYCGNCGVEVILQSKKLTAFIDKLTGQQQRG